MTRALLLAPALLLLISCPTTEPPDEEPPPYEGVVITEFVPADGATDFLFTATLYVHFDEMPEEATAVLSTAAGESVGAAVALENDGLTLRVDPFVPLEPSTAYVWTVTLAPSSIGSFEASFSTGPHGAPLSVDAEDLVGRTYRIEVEPADLVDPPGAGPVISTYLTETPILIAVTERSSFEAEAQPGVYLLGALGVYDGETISQNLCRGTTSLSAGADAEPLTDDDIPSTWDDPILQMGPHDLPLEVSGVLAGIYDLDLRWVVHPDLNDFEDGAFSGIVDTRWLDSLTPGGELGSACELLDAVGLTCEECPGGTPGAFCVELRGEHMTAQPVPEVVLEERTCADVIARWVDLADCEEQAASLDPDDDGSYADCPEWTTR
ncbi:MAG: Ig-like domain-containing protein [Proteobacteria bacterium]|nr:Ig-like domain-containing protein [Pseudomonadota bacterium]